MEKVMEKLANAMRANYLRGKSKILPYETRIRPSSTSRR